MGWVQLIRIRHYLPASVTAMLAAVLFILQSSTALGSDVNVEIPPTIIAITGHTSPYANVTIYEDDNDSPSASLIADENGLFYRELQQYRSGIVEISIQALDSDARYTTIISKDVAIISQQTSTLTILLPPSVEPTPKISTYGSGVVTFIGRSIPESQVRVSIKPDLYLTGETDAEGMYSIPLLISSLGSPGIYTYGIEAIKGIEISDYVVAGTFVVAPPSQNARSPLVNGIPDALNNTLIVPQITSPSQNFIVTGSPMILTGTATAITELIVYDDGKVIGSVSVDADGKWYYYFSPFKLLHKLQVKSCRGVECSALSRSIEIKRPEGTHPRCTQQASLENYRLISKTNVNTELTVTVPDGAESIAFISWGDGSEETFDPPDTSRFSVNHSYHENGTYSGYALINDGQSCQYVLRFSAQVSDNYSQMYLAFSAAIITGSLLAVGVRQWLQNGLYK